MKVENIEAYIISGLLKTKEFSNIAISFTKPEYFESAPARKLIELIIHYTMEYKTLPKRESLEIELDKDKTLTEQTYKDSIEFLGTVFKIDHTDTDIEYLTNTCEKYYQKRAMFNAILQSISIIDGKDKKLKEEAIPDIMYEALNVCFDMQVGHDYFEDIARRYEKEEEEKIPFKLSLLNTITNGGIPKKTLTVITATSGGGKSMMMSDWGSYLLKKGYNVIYFTMELAEKKVGHRFDANIFDIPIQKIEDIGVEVLKTQIDVIKQSTHGRLFIKEFPIGSASVMDFKRVINELKLKKNFKPDIIFVDYLGICASSRLKSGDANSYGFAKAVAEELRGMGQEHDVPVVTGAQINRSGFDAKAGVAGVGMDSIADSIGIAFTADLMVSIYSNEELKESGHVIISQLKNRFGDPDKFKRFKVGQDSSRMKFFDDDGENSDLFDKYKHEDELLMQTVANVNTFSKMNFDD